MAASRSPGSCSPRSASRSWLTGSRRHSPLSRPRFWLLAGLILAAACWRDYGPSVAPPAAAQPVAAQPAVAENAAAENALEASPQDTAPPAAGHPAVPVTPSAEHGLPGEVAAAHYEGGHSDPVAPVLAAIILILFLAKLGGDFFERLSLPAVLGELIVGIVLGNLVLLTGWHTLDFMQPPAVAAQEAPAIETADQAEAVRAEAERESHGAISVGAVLQILAGIGVILLLFEVGLESTVAQMLSVGVSSFIVAILGVVAPIAMGYFICRWFFFDSWQQPIFIGATLCATSVGITARVLKDIGRSRDKESQIILGAAVIDDVLGLIVLAVVSGVIAATDPSRAAVAGEGPLWWTITKIVLWAFGFIGGSLALGVLAVPKLFFNAATYLRGHGMLIVTALLICFGMAYAANYIGLAPIVGAFAAGLILETAHYKDLATRDHVELEEALHPLTAVFVPIFFVQMGMGVNLSSLGNPAMWGLAITISVIAVIGKQVCSLGVTEKGLNRLAIGLGMIPRGEVGLIFADAGRKLKIGGVPVIDDLTFSAVIFMVLVTTLVTPPLLKWAMNRGGTPMSGDVPRPPGLDHGNC